MSVRAFLSLLLLSGAFLAAHAQSTTPIIADEVSGDSTDKTPVSRVMQGLDSVQAIAQLPTRYLHKVNAKTQLLSRRMTKRSVKALRRLQRQEEKMKARLMKIDSLAAHNLFTRSIDSLGHLRDMVQGKVARVTQLKDKIPGGQYIPYLDTLQGSLRFLDRYTSRLDQVGALEKKLQSSLGNVRQLEGQLDQLQDIQQYLRDRQQLLTEALGRYGQTFSRSLGRFGKEAYYYQAQLQHYKELWQHPDALEAKAMELLQQLPAFRSFMQEHSELAGVFPLGSGLVRDPAEALQGLQTRAMVERDIQRQLAGAGADGRQRIAQQMQMARQQLKNLKDRLPGNGGEVSGMPGFKPDEMKSRTFLERLAFGGNVSFAPSTTYFPTTSDLAAQVAYRFSDKGSAGVGAAYRLGWGSNIRKIRFSSQGAGLRSFADFRIKGSVYVNGGFEFNLNKTDPEAPALEDWNGWTRSALLGIEKKYKISDKVRGNMMLLFDFLYKAHFPRTQPVVFRVGYNF